MSTKDIVASSAKRAFGVGLNAHCLVSPSAHVMDYRGVAIYVSVRLMRDPLFSDYDLWFTYKSAHGTEYGVSSHQLASYLAGDEEDALLWHYAMVHTLCFNELTDEALDILKPLLDTHWVGNPDAPALSA